MGKNINKISEEGHKSIKAFTLAEILITLAIIGVVAALTIPSVVANYQKEQTVVKLKKIYSVLSQAIYQTRTEDSLNVDYRLTDGHNEFFKKFLYPHLRIKDTCSNDNTPKCSGSWTKLNNSDTTQSSSGFVMEDGAYVGVFCWTFNTERKDFCNITIDINGANNGPNKLGRDCFIFAYHLEKNAKLIPYGTYGSDYSAEYYKGTSASWNCNKERGGEACAALIMKQGWRITDDYPW